jgi:hypothetical protein
VLLAQEVGSLRRKLLLYSLGAFNGAVQYALGLLARGGLDLTIFWIPAPFVAFWEYQMLAESLRVDGFEVFFDAAWHDVYLFFVYEKALNFLTLTLWSKCISTNGYQRWIDSRFRWLDGRPAHCAEEGAFVFYGASLPLAARCRLRFGVCNQLGVLHELSAQWRFGGAPVEFKPLPTQREWLWAYYARSCCGFGGAWRELLDARLAWRAPPGPPLEPAAPQREAPKYFAHPQQAAPQFVGSPQQVLAPQPLGSPQQAPPQYFGFPQQQAPPQYFGSPLLAPPQHFGSLQQAPPPYPMRSLLPAGHFMAPHYAPPSHLAPPLQPPHRSNFAPPYPGPHGAAPHQAPLLSAAPQQGAAPPPASHPPPPTTWRRAADGEDAWFVNVATGEVAWELPPGGQTVDG